MDPAVKPGDDFFRYAVGNWLRSTEIPDDLMSLSTNLSLHLRAQEDLKNVIENMIAADPAAGTTQRKIVEYYNSCMDIDAINAAGLEPFREDLGAIAALQSHEDVAALMGTRGIPAGSIFSVDRVPDFKNPDRFIASIEQSGLGLPDRSFYLEEKFVPLLEQYREHIANMLRQVGYADEGMAAGRIVALERAIAEAHAPRAELRDRDKIYNIRTRAEIGTDADQFPWDAYLSAMELGDFDPFMVESPSVTKALAMLFTETPVSTWRAYLAYHYVTAQADIMPTSVYDT